MTESPLSLAAVGGLLSGITTAVFDALDDMLTTLFPASYGEIAAAERHRKSLQPFETEFEQALTPRRRPALHQGLMQGRCCTQHRGEQRPS